MRQRRRRWSTSQLRRPSSPPVERVLRPSLRIRGAWVLSAGGKAPGPPQSNMKRAPDRPLWAFVYLRSNGEGDDDGQQRTAATRTEQQRKRTGPAIHAWPRGSQLVRPFGTRNADRFATGQGPLA